MATPAKQLMLRLLRQRRRTFGEQILDHGQRAGARVRDQQVPRHRIDGAASWAVAHGDPSPLRPVTDTKNAYGAGAAVADIQAISCRGNGGADGRTVGFHRAGHG